MALAVLTDGSKPKTFPLHPEAIKVNIAGDYVSNSVLDTANPLIRRKSSAKTYAIDRILLYSYAGDIDFQPLITTLQYWASQQTRLKFTCDIHRVPICYIKSLTYEVKRWKGAKVLQAEMSIEIICGVEESSFTRPKSDTKKPTKSITPREQIKKKESIKQKLKSPNKKKILALVDDSFSVEVSDANIVYIDGKEYEYETLINQIG